MAASFDAEVLHQPGRVRGVQAHAVRQDRLGRFPPAEPVLDDDPVALPGEGVDLALPVPAVVAAPVVEDHGAAVRRTHRRDVHVGDPHVLAEHPEVHELDRMRILVSLQVDRDRPPLGGRLGRRVMRLRRDDARQHEGQHGREHQCAERARAEAFDGHSSSPVAADSPIVARKSSPAAPIPAQPRLATSLHGSTAHTGNRNRCRRLQFVPNRVSLPACTVYGRSPVAENRRPRLRFHPVEPGRGLRTSGA